MARPHPGNWDRYIRLSIDYGTGFLKLAVQYVHPGQNKTDEGIYNVKLDDYNDNDEVEIEQIGVWVNKHPELPNGGLLWGRRKVNDWLRKHPTEHKEVLSAWKLALVPEFRKREAVERTVKALGCETTGISHIASLQDVIADHLRQIKAAVLKWCTTKHPDNHRLRPDWENMPWEAQIAVPAMWDRVANGVMINAAHSAGFPYVNLREEPQCVAGAVMSQFYSRGIISENDAVLFFDVGAGTSDASIVRFRHASRHASRMTLERVGSSKGNQGGAFVVNDEGWKVFKEHSTVLEFGGVSGLCKKLGITDDECRHQVFAQFERIKREFSQDEQRSFNIVVYPLPTLEDADMPAVGPAHIHFRRQDVEKMHDTWATMNENLLDDILAQTPEWHTAVFTGGGQKNKYLRRRLTVKLLRHGIHVREMDIEHSCSRGALLHYFLEKDQARGEGSSTCYITETQTFDQRVHTEAHVEPQPYKWDPDELIVQDRLVKIMEIDNGEEQFVNAVPREFHIDKKYPSRLHFDIYGTDQPHLHKLHGALRDEDGNVYSDLVKYPIAFVDLPNLYVPPLSFRAVTVKRKTLGHYVVRGLVEMHKVDDAFELVVRLFKRRFEWQCDQNDKLFPKQTYTQDDVFFTQTRIIWNSYCSSFVQSNVAGDRGTFANSLDRAASQAFDEVAYSSDVTMGNSNKPPVVKPKKKMGKRTRGQLQGRPKKTPRRR